MQALLVGQPAPRPTPQAHNLRWGPSQPQSQTSSQASSQEHLAVSSDGVTAPGPSACPREPEHVQQSTCLPAPPTSLAEAVPSAGVGAALEALHASLAEQQRQQDLQAGALREGLMELHEQRVALARLAEQRSGAGGAPTEPLAAACREELTSRLEAESEARRASVAELHARLERELAEVTRTASRHHEELVAALDAERAMRSHEAAELRVALVVADGDRTAGSAQVASPTAAAVANSGTGPSLVPAAPELSFCSWLEQAANGERVVCTSEASELRGMLEALAERSCKLATHTPATLPMETLLATVMERVERRLGQHLDATRELAAAAAAQAVALACRGAGETGSPGASSSSGGTGASASPLEAAALTLEVRRLTATLDAAPWAAVSEALREELAQTKRLTEVLGARQEALREEVASCVQLSHETAAMLLGADALGEAATASGADAGAGAGPSAAGRPVAGTCSAAAIGEGCDLPAEVQSDGPIAGGATPPPTTRPAAPAVATPGEEAAEDGSPLRRAVGSLFGRAV